MPISHRYVLLSALLAATAFPISASAAIFRVGSGTGCTHSTIQAAVNAARFSSGFDTIRITQSLTYVSQAITIRDQDVALSGGYIDCRSVDRDGLRHTTLSGAGGSLRSVIQVYGWGAVYLSNLEIRDGDDVGTGDQYGGGIDIADGPHGVVLYDVVVAGNRAGRGGGVSIRNGYSSEPRDAQLMILNDTNIDSNSSAMTGGGVYCSNATLTMNGPRNRIWGNSAAWAGGGLRVEDCQANLSSASNDPAHGTISFNTAHDGGGLSAGGARSVVKLYQSDASAPFSIYGNLAHGQGGALEAESGARVTGYDLLLLDNLAEGGGGAVRVAHVAGSLPAYTTGAKFYMQRSLVDAPYGAVNCKPSLNCNRIAGNIARSSSGALTPGGAIVLHGDHGSVGPSNSWPLINAILLGTTLRDNIGSSFVEFVPGRSFANLGMDGVVIVRNTSLRPLINISKVEFGSLAYLAAATIAENKIADQIVFGMSDNAIVLHRSIVDQPGARTLAWIDGPFDDFRIQYVLARDFTGMPNAAHRVLLGDSGFIDPALGNYRLRTGSVALDFAPAPDPQWPDTEADGAPRVVDLAGQTNRFGAQDLGAYERQSD